MKNSSKIRSADEITEAKYNKKLKNVLCQEYSMTHLNNPPPLNFDVHITEEDMERAKKMYENAIKSMELPRAITHQYLSELHYNSQKQLYDDWFSTWNQQLGHLRLYQRYRSLQLANFRCSGHFRRPPVLPIPDVDVTIEECKYCVLSYICSFLQYNENTKIFYFTSE